MNKGPSMEFKGAVKISRCKVDKACINFKNIHDQSMALLDKKKEESKTIVIPFYIFGIKVPFLKTTKYHEYGFEDDCNYKRYCAHRNLIVDMLKDLPEGPIRDLLLIYNTPQFDRYVSCCKELDNLRKMETGGVIINPQQAKFVHDYYNIHRGG